MADDDKPLRVSENDKLKAQHVGVWKGGAPHERNRLRAGILASMGEMAESDHQGDDRTALHVALEVQRLAVLLVQHILEHGV